MSRGSWKPWNEDEKKILFKLIDPQVSLGLLTERFNDACPERTRTEGAIAHRVLSYVTVTLLEEACPLVESARAHTRAVARERSKRMGRRRVSPPSPPPMAGTRADVLEAVRTGKLSLREGLEILNGANRAL